MTSSGTSDLQVSRTGSAGFSLLEVLIVLAILGLLLGVALPGYEGQLQRVKRSTALVVLENLRARQEQFFLHHHRYAEDFTELGFGSEDYTIDAEGREVTEDAAGRSYRIVLREVTAMGFELRAYAQLRQQRDEGCRELAIDARGLRTASPGTVSDCW